MLGSLFAVQTRCELRCAGIFLLKRWRVGHDHNILPVDSTHCLLTLFRPRHGSFMHARFKADMSWDIVPRLRFHHVPAVSEVAQNPCKWQPTSQMVAKSCSIPIGPRRHMTRASKNEHATSRYYSPDSRDALTVSPGFGKPPHFGCCGFAMQMLGCMAFALATLSCFSCMVANRSIRTYVPAANRV